MRSRYIVLLEELNHVDRDWCVFYDIDCARSAAEGWQQTGCYSVVELWDRLVGLIQTYC